VYVFGLLLRGNQRPQKWMNSCSSLSLILKYASLLIVYQSQALKEQSPASKDTDNGILNSSAFLNMIDTRIGLARFTDILRKPFNYNKVDVQLVKKLTVDLYVSPGYKKYYEQHVEAIRNRLFEFYTGGNNETDSDKDSPLHQIIYIQKNKISELEYKLSQLNQLEGDVADEIVNEKHDQEIIQLQAKIDELQQTLVEQAKAYDDLNAHRIEMSKHTETLQERLSIAESKKNECDNEQTASLKATTENLAKQNQELTQMNENSAKEILALKESILALDNEKYRLNQLLAQKERKIEILEEEMRSPIAIEGL
jgi:hypothetical protein